MIKLLIENIEIEITDDIQVAITKQFEELSNPTTIINDWSKTVSIPFTVNNNKIFGNIYNADRLITHEVSTNYISGSPSSIKKWNGSSYVTDSLADGEIVCPLSVEYVQVGFQNQNWRYTKTINYECNNDSHTYEFIYNSTDDYRFEFSFRNLSSVAPNNEVYFVQWTLNNLGLVNGEKYEVTFSHRKSGNSYIIYNYAISAKEPLVGVNFNPLQKLDFRIEWNNDVLMSGYAKMNEIKQTAGKGVYNITLFGQLGKLFQEMQKITFDKTVNDTSYLIDGSKYVDEYISKTLIYDCWNSTGQTQSELLEKGDSGYTVTDIIGFAPNNTFSEGFDYKTVQMSTASSQLFKDLLGETFTQNTGTEPDTAIPNGLLPREFGEYRSYLQLPYIYWNKLFQIFQRKAESVTGYQFNLDSDWFNTSNPYWYNLVYMLKPFDTKSEEKVTNRYITPMYSINWGSAEPSGWTTLQTSQIRFSQSSTEVVPIVDYTTNTITLSNDYDVLINTEYELELNQNRYEDLRINPSNGLNYQIRVTDVNGNLLNKIDGLIVDYDYTGSTEGYTTVLRCSQVTHVWNFYQQISMVLNKGKYGSQVKLEFGAKWLNSNAPFLYNGSGIFPENAISLYLNRDMYNILFNVEVISNSHRSYSYFTLNNLWNKDYNLFGEILKYCKIYRISISVDEFNKTISFKPYNNYFADYSVVDWTDKIDKSKDFTITPVTFDNKYVLFNYKNSDTELGKSYKEKYGVNYGDYRLITSYNFNNNTTQLFEDITPSIVNTDNVLSWTNLKSNNTIKYSFPAEIFVYNKNKDKKQVDIFGAYFFNNGRATFSTESGLYMRDVYITDDTIYQNANNGYFFIANNIESGNRTRVYYYPKLDIVNNNNLCVFNVPKDNYTYLNNYSNKNSIYSNFWKKYLEEKYNVQNKKITCYILLKPTDYNQFKWNKLVRVNNQLCMVNQIYDYDVTSNVPTKVDLITIQDITGYTTNNYSA